MGLLKTMLVVFAGTGRETDSKRPRPYFYVCMLLIAFLLLPVRLYAADPVKAERNYLRTVKIGGVGNVRDLGGTKTRSGKRVKTGMVYRSANLNKITEAGKKKLKEELGVKTDLDLRKPGEGGAGKKSPAGLKYKNITGKAYENIYKKKSGRKALVKAMKVFASKKNYPIIFHCTAGRDRAGTLAMVLEGVLGVKKKYIFKDYELTYSSSYKGSAASAKTRRKRFKTAYKYFATYKDRKRSFQYNVTEFLYDNGMKKSEIKKIRKILLS